MTDHDDDLIIQLGAVTLSGPSIMQAFYEAASDDDLEQVQEIIRQGAQFDAGALDAAVGAENGQVLRWLLSDETRQNVLGSWGWDWDRDDILHAIETAAAWAKDFEKDEYDQTQQFLNEYLVRWDRAVLEHVPGDEEHQAANQNQRPRRRV